MVIKSITYALRYIYIYILVKKMIKFSYREEKKFEMHQNNKFETQKIKRIWPI